MPGLKDRLVTALQNLTTLEVTTRVGEMTIQVKAQGDATVTVREDVFKSGAYTRIDLLDGDTFNNLTPDMLDAAHADLRAFHQQAVKDAQSLIDKRIVLIQQAADWLGDKVKDLIDRADNQPSNPGAKGDNKGGQAGGQANGEQAGGQAGGGQAGAQANGGQAGKTG